MASVTCYLVHVGGLFLVQQKVWLRAEDIKFWGRLIGLNHVLQCTEGGFDFRSLCSVFSCSWDPYYIMWFSLTGVYVPPCGFEAGQQSSVHTLSI